MTTMTQTVSREIAAALPQVAIDYLWDLAAQKPGASHHAFLLTKAQMSDRPVQEILHLADDGERIWHKVYGFQPVSMAISVASSDSGLHMALSGPLEAIGTLG